MFLINLIANRYVLGIAAFAYFSVPVQIVAVDLLNQVNEVLTMVNGG